MKTIRLLFCLALGFSLSTVSAQDILPEEKKGFQKEKLFFGGNFGLTFGDYTLINLSPQVGYRFNQYFAAGMGVNAQYVSIKERDFYGNDYRKVSQGVAGLNVFGRVYPFRQVMLQVQPEGNYIFGKQTFYNPREEYKIDTEIVPSLLVGGGLVLGGQGRGEFIISLMYDLLQRQNSPYGSRPFINFGYNF
jgi:hypothetical protein